MSDDPTINDIDALMEKDPLGLSKQDLDAIIDWHRKQRARRASGQKPEKPTGPTKSLAELLGSIVPPKPQGGSVKRRI